jgi:hypothetical protein
MPQLVLLNPIGARHMARHRRRRHARTSSGRGAFTKPLSLVAPAVTGAAGALVVNGIINYAPIPDQLKAGNLLYLTRAGIAILLGMFGPRLPVVGRFAHAAALGSLIVTTTDFGKLLALQQGVNLSGLGYIGPARVLTGPGRGNNVGRFVPRNAMSAPGVGAFIPRR